MGDRAQVKIEPTGVYLYTHWNGFELPLTVRGALAKRWRWNDPPYLARILFDAMTEGCHGEEIGHGIMAEQWHTNHSLIVVDTESQTVSLGGEARWTFHEYVELPDDDPHFAMF